jgi:PAS domain S-box-containing protein
MIMFLIAYIIPFTSGTVTEVIMPIMQIKAPPMTSMFFSITGFLIAYAIVKYEFLAISPSLALEKVFDTMHDGLIVVDNNGKLTLFNTVASTLCGYDKGEMLDKPLSSILKNTDGSDFLINTWSDSPSVIQRMQILPKSGADPISVEVNCATLKMASGAVNGYVLVVHNISSRETLISHLQEKTTELEKSKVEMEKIVSEVKEMNNMMVNREMRMVELKKENDLLKKQINPTL